MYKGGYQIIDLEKFPAIYDVDDGDFSTTIYNSIDLLPKVETGKPILITNLTFVIPNENLRIKIEPFFATYIIIKRPTEVVFKFSTNAIRDVAYMINNILGNILNINFSPNGDFYYSL